MKYFVKPFYSFRRETLKLPIKDQWKICFKDPAILLLLGIDIIFLITFFI